MHYVPGMSLLAWKASQGQLGASRGGPVVVRREGEAIFEDGPYPRSLVDYVGQRTAKVQLIAAMTSARMQQRPMDHVLLASGTPGIGKTALAKLVAFHLGVGVVELGGAVGENEIAKALREMRDFDVLFLDEVHRLVNRGKAKAEWLLTLMQDGYLALPRGRVQAPRITIIAATTDAQKLPETILDRFPLKPVLVPYDDVEATLIALAHARRMGFGVVQGLPLPEDRGWLLRAAQACNNNPRRMHTLLTSVRDDALANGATMAADGYALDTALSWGGLTDDGLDQLAQGYLIGLLSYGGVAGASTMKALLNEEQVVHTEKLLIQKGLVLISGRGRMLTDMGEARAQQLADQMLARSQVPNPVSSSLGVHP